MTTRAHALQRLLHLLGSAVVGQALLSAANLVVGILLLRYAHEQQYGRYVLVSTAILLLTALQGAFIGPPLVQRLAALSRAARNALAAGAWREQRRLIVALALPFAALLALAAGASTTVATLLPVTLAGLLAGALSLRRGHYRFLLQAHRHPWPLLAGDALYALLLVAGVALACRRPEAATAAALAVALAALLSSQLNAGALQRLEGATPQAAPGVLRELAPLGLWSAAGAAIHWTFGQGYNYLVAGLLDVGAVAAIAGTRLVLMPVNLLSTGIGSALLPVTTAWLQRESPRAVLQRLGLIAAVIGLLALAYCALLWQCRDWLYAVVLRKSFAQRDVLLALWTAAVVVAATRDPLLYLLVARQRLRALTLLTGVSALAAVGAIVAAVPHYGAPGAVAGVLIGECTSLAGVLLLSWRETRSADAPAAAAAPLEMTT
ncbi:hypothetical protein [Solimonas variicoloris]|uniref:hypothetical protein n=1 Tax=Solimonas variicoloris TaxID=254408 RepID=UPI000368A532|nr:hypothetical protein [Solimonas variicoloris]